MIKSTLSTFSRSNEKWSKKFLKKWIEGFAPLLLKVDFFKVDIIIWHLENSEVLIMHLTAI